IPSPSRVRSSIPHRSPSSTNSPRAFTGEPDVTPRGLRPQTPPSREPSIKNDPKRGRFFKYTYSPSKLICSPGPPEPSLPEPSHPPLTSDSSSTPSPRAGSWPSLRVYRSAPAACSCQTLPHPSATHRSPASGDTGPRLWRGEEKVSPHAHPAPRCPYTLRSSIA